MIFEKFRRREKLMLTFILLFIGVPLIVTIPMGEGFKDEGDVLGKIFDEEIRESDVRDIIWRWFRVFKVDENAARGMLLSEEIEQSMRRAYGLAAEKMEQEKLAWQNLVLLRSALRAGIGASDREVDRFRDFLLALDRIGDFYSTIFNINVRGGGFQTSMEQFRETLEISETSFDAGFFELYLNRIGMTEREYRQTLRQRIIIEKYLDFLCIPAVATSDEVFNEFKEENEKVKIRFAEIPLEMFKLGEGEVTEEDLLTYYEKHKKEKYMTPEAREFEILFLEFEKLRRHAPDPTEQQMLAYYDRRKNPDFIRQPLPPGLPPQEQPSDEPSETPPPEGETEKQPSEQPEEQEDDQTPEPSGEAPTELPPPEVPAEERPETEGEIPPEETVPSPMDEPSEEPLPEDLAPEEESKREQKETPIPEEESQPDSPGSLRDLRDMRFIWGQAPGELEGAAGTSAGGAEETGEPAEMESPKEGAVEESQLDEAEQLPEGSEGATEPASEGAEGEASPVEEHAVEPKAKPEVEFKSFEEVRNEIFDKMKMDAMKQLARDIFWRVLDDLDYDPDLYFKDIPGRKDYAAYGIEHHRIRPVSRDNTSAVEILCGRAEMFTGSAFTLPLKEISSICETDKGVFIFMATEMIPAHPKEFDSVRSEVERDLERERAEKKAEEKAALLVENVRQSTFEEVIEKREQLKVRYPDPFLRGGSIPNDVGYKPNLSEKAFELEVNEVGYVRDGDSWFVVECLEKLPPTQEDFEKDRAATQESLRFRRFGEMRRRRVDEIVKRAGFELYDRGRRTEDEPEGKEEKE